MKLWKSGLFRDFLTLSSGETIGRILGFLAFAYLARALGPDAFGAVEFAIAICLFFALFIEFGLGAIGVRELCQDREQIPSLAALIPAARFLLAIIVIPLLAACVSLLGQPAQTVKLVWLFSLGLLAGAWTQTWLLQGLEMMRSVAVVGILRTTVFLTIVVIFVRSPEDLLSVGWAEIAAATCGAIFTLVTQHFRVTPIRVRFSISAFAHLARRSMPLAMSQLVWAANQYVPVLLVASLLGSAETAFFGAANRILVALLIFSHIYHFNLYPSMARGAAKTGKSIAEIVGPSIRVVSWTTVPLALVFSLLSTPIISLAFGAEFEAAAPAFAILVWAFPVAVLSGHARWTLIASGHEKRVLHAQLSGMLVTVTFGVLLVPWLHEVGAAIAVVFASLTVWAVAHGFAKSITRLPLLATAARPVVLAVVVAACCLLMGASPLITIILVAAVFAVCGPVIDSRLLPDLKLLALTKNT